MTAKDRVNETIQRLHRRKLRSFRLRVVSPTVCSPTVRVDSPTSHMSVRLRVKTCVTTVYSSTLCAIALGS